MQNVFVPCWGSLFQNLLAKEEKRKEQYGFRPLLGFFISKFGNIEWQYYSYDMFSSPTGVLYFKMIMQSSCGTKETSFRPLLGFFISKCENWHIWPNG